MDALEFVEKKVTLVVIIIMIINIWAAVLFRYILHASLFWSEELGRYLMIWFGYIGCAFALKENAHVNINLFTDLLPPKGRRAAGLFSNIVISIFLVIVFIKSIKYFGNLGGQLSSALMIPMIVPYLSVTVGMALMFFVNISNMFDLIIAPLPEPRKRKSSRSAK